MRKRIVIRRARLENFQGIYKVQFNNNLRGIKKKERIINDSNKDKIRLKRTKNSSINKRFADKLNKIMVGFHFSSILISFKSHSISFSLI